jgi:long-chain acyl-CoA synthetase
MAHLLASKLDDRADLTAVVDGNGSATFAELNDRVNRVVDAARTAGVQVGDTVAVMCGNRSELVEITLAACHAGWVVVPVNWHWVADELHHVLVDSAAVALFCDATHAGVAAEAAGRLDDGACRLRVCITDGPDAARPGTAVPDGFVDYAQWAASGSAAEPDDQCTGGPMFYTSGTTGFPKGVRGSLNRTGEDIVLWELVAGSFVGMLGLPAGGVTLLDGPMYHSAQWVFAMFPLMATGSTLVIRDRFDPAATLVAIDTYQVTNIHLVPTQFVRLLKLDDGVRAGFDGSSLVTVMHGAAPCPPDVKRAMLGWWGPVVSEYYGGTEGGFLTMISGPEWLERPGSLGRATPMADVAIFDDDGNPCGPGQAGQIWFSSKVGADFAYHNDPDKTAAAHRSDGMGTLGDIGYLDDDGYLFMSDRRIDMVISGGVNIYPAEIEAVLVGHPAVADAAVYGIPHDEFGEQVMASVELVPGHDVADADAVVADLADHCGQHLAGYKVPRIIEVVDALPRQPTGKLYKRLLRDPHWEGTGRRI